MVKFFLLAAADQTGRPICDAVHQSDREYAIQRLEGRDAGMNSLDRRSSQRDFVFRTHRPLVFGIGLLLRVLLGITLFVGTVAQASAQGSFDHSRWDSLLSRHVHWIRAEQASAVDYRGMRAEADELEGYLQQVAAVERSAFGELGEKRAARLFNQCLQTPRRLR